MGDRPRRTPRRRGAGDGGGEETPRPAPTRVIAAAPPRPPAEPVRGSLRDRLRTARVAGAASLAAAPQPERPREPERTGPRAADPSAPAATADPLRRRGLDFAAVERAPLPVPRPGGGGSARDRDESFREVLKTREVEPIARESLRRLEAGRRRLAAETVETRQRELRLLERELARLKEAGGADKAALIADLALRVEAELSAAKRTQRDIERAEKAGAGVIAAVGRVLDAKGAPVTGAEVALADAEGRIIENLPRPKTDADGMVWIALDERQAKLVAARGGRVSARAFRDGAQIAADGYVAPVAPGSVYSFDLRERGGPR